MNITYNDLLLEFMREKHKLIKTATGVEYLYPEDIEWLKNLDEKFCKMFFTNLNEGRSIDTQICPWCIMFKSDCTRCTYALSHEPCTADENSTYEEITCRTEGTIASIPGVENLVEKYCIKANELLKQGEIK